ncbi:phenylacetate--CoA ligase family protein [Nocardia sp. SYP-A9097]|uniref:phenylacetate--CoA ligase family protein n=1 Tax=Nocardia sp. SYP-A9097 TaxID=2663237 RepID=UPI0018914F73|nr:AMP-binding protein [Nocardia sp. SYP-A9097]
MERQQEKIRVWRESPAERGGERGAELAELVTRAAALQAYRQVWRTVDIAAVTAAAHTDPWVALRALPLVDKGFSRLLGDEVIALADGRLSNYFETSGTTSAPAPAPKSTADLVVNTINFGEHWASFLGGARFAIVLINTPQGPAAFQFEIALNYLGIGTFRTWVDALRNDYSRVLAVIERTRPDVFAGPPSQLLNLYERAYAAGSRPPEFETVLLTGERTGPALRRRLAALTGATVVDASYGSSETGTTAVAVSADELRLQTQSFLFELIVEDTAGRTVTIAAEQRVHERGTAEGELVVTTLDNRFRPLVRYRTGDLVRVERATGGGLALRPLGRVGDSVDIAGQGIDQQLIENAVWGDPGLAVVNYLLAHDGDRVDLFYTSSAPVDAVESAAAENDRVTAAIRAVLPGAVARRVPQLPASAALGSAAGWKAARVIDIGPDAALADGAVPHLADVLRQTREFALATRDGEVVTL